MFLLHLKIITPKKVVKEVDVISLTVPTDNGEITILPHHVNLFTLLVAGAIKIKKSEMEEELFAIGGGYLQTDGKEAIVLVSKAYGQDEIDENLINKAVNNAKNILKMSKNQKEIAEATAVMRRAVFFTKLLKKKKKYKSL